MLRVALNRLRKVPEGMLELSQEGDAEETAEQHASCPAVETVELSQPQATEPKNDCQFLPDASNVWKGRLRVRPGSSGDARC